MIIKLMIINSNECMYVFFWYYYDCNWSGNAVVCSHSLSMALSVSAAALSLSLRLSSG